MKAFFVPVAGLAMVLATSAVQAQSLVINIPGNAQVTNGGNPNSNGGSMWVCGQGSVNAQGNNNTLYVDQQSDVVLDGNNGVIYSVSTGQIRVQGNNNEVYTTTASSVSIDGNNNVVHGPGSLSVTFDGNNNSRVALNSLTFNYSGAPSGGCATVTGIRKPSASLHAAPNPAQSGSYLTLTSDQALQGDIWLGDVAGRMVRRYPAGTSQLSLQGVPAGMYNVHLSQSGTPVTLAVMVQ